MVLSGEIGVKFRAGFPAGGGTEQTCSAMTDAGAVISVCPMSYVRSILNGRKSR